jgi:hypothetical protein
MHLALDEKNNIAGLKCLQHRLLGMLGHLGMHEHHLLDHSIYRHKGMPIGATALRAGTVRFATTRRVRLSTSTARHTTGHAVDTSFFLSVGTVNPSATTSPPG